VYVKKIIDHKVYDADTATEIASWDNGCYGNDFRSCSETLYKTGNGTYFLLGKGGPMSKYAESHGNSTCGGKDITVLTDEEAYEWMERHATPDETMTEFGHLIEEG
jgi:hypothetical protein